MGLNNDKVSLLNTLYKEQYRLKLVIVYLFASGFNFILIILILINLKMGSSLVFNITAYMFLMTIYYKFVFKQTKDGGFYRVFLFNSLSKFNRKIDDEVKILLKENSAKNIRSKL
ncbi:hypothetical protein CBLAS_0858 [Campylobacter blaseri]|uniref:Uncharacterized protein n=1 Tax=Campylobacter blaseri TaxID=2042961 RepID=A0A2P8R2P9_9BACT|nr:hypothetical protein [Campylobacter blaseri]PSM52738.1 hypothetical protein CQ405_03145 [Campylobacter blaseri]PSM54386.1 hypothetical protein CRN67_03145 [Campylobacter blaseri]QKF86043.1 hypothetical protein CBLAS_0858 [Campylobacter blaseri]